MIENATPAIQTVTKVQDLSWQTVLLIIATAIVVLSAYNTYMTAKSNHAKDVADKNKPTKTLEDKMSAHDAMLASDKRRIESLQERQLIHEEEMKLLLRSQLALLRHGIDGNNIQGLKDCQTDIQNYLVNKR